MSFFNKLRIKKTDLKNPLGGLKDVANSLGNTSKTILDREVTKDANAATAKHRSTLLKNQGKRDSDTNIYRNNTLEFNKTKETNQNSRWSKTFDQTTKQNSVRNSQWSKTFNKPDYKTFTSTDKDGSPVMSVFNTKNGKTTTTGSKVYQAPKVYSQEQKNYHKAKTNDIKVKQSDSIVKSFKEDDIYENLSKDDKYRAIQYIRKNGKLPNLKHIDGLFSDTFSMPKKKTTKKSGSSLDLGL